MHYVVPSGQAKSVKGPPIVRQNTVYIHMDDFLLGRHHGGGLAAHKSSKIKASMLGLPCYKLLQSAVTIHVVTLSMIFLVDMIPVNQCSTALLLCHLHIPTDGVHKGCVKRLCACICCRCLVLLR